MSSHRLFSVLLLVLLAALVSGEQNATNVTEAINVTTTAAPETTATTTTAAATQATTEAPPTTTAAPPTTTVAATNASEAPETTIAPTTEVPPTPEPTPVPPPTTAVPTPAPAYTTPTVNGAYVTTTEKLTWEVVRNEIRRLLCDYRFCAGFSDTQADSWDIYIIGMSEADATNVNLKWDLFAVSFNTSGMLYEILGMPTELLATANVAQLSAVRQLTPEQDRGPNPVWIHTLFKEGINDTRTAYRNFVFARERWMRLYYGKAPYPAGFSLLDYTLIGCQTTRDVSGYYLSRWLVTTRTVSQQMELLIGNWSLADQFPAVANTAVVHTGLPGWASRDPLDENAPASVNTMLNRLEFEFEYTPQNVEDDPYFSFYSLALTMSVSSERFTGGEQRFTAVTQQELVNGSITTGSNGRLLQKFVVSYPSNDQRVHLMALKNENRLVLTAGLTLDEMDYSGASDEVADGEDDAKKPVGLILGIICIVGVAIGVVVVIARRTDGELASDPHEELMSNLSNMKEDLS